MRKIAIIGAGGFGQEVFCIWRDMLDAKNIQYDFVGFFDDTDALKENSYGLVVGKIDDLNTIDYPLEVAIAIGKPNFILSVRNRLNNENLTFPNIIHPTVKFLDGTSTILGQGNILSLDVIISCSCNVGDFNIFNTRSTLGHHDYVGNYNVFSPNAQISGTVTIGNENFLGFNCGIIQNKKIGNRNLVGAGAILVRSIKDDGTYIGVPAVKMKI